MAISLTCRSCGRPLDDGGDRPGGQCGSCGATQPLEAETWRQLVRYRDRLRRGEQRLRSAIFFQLATAQTELWGKKLGLGAMAVLVLGLAGGGAALVPIVLGEQRLGTSLTLLLAFVWFVAICVGLVGWIAGLMWISGRLGARAAKQAREYGSGLRSTMPARCSQCGAMAQVLVVGAGAAESCPYCQSPLVPEGETRDLMAATLETMSASEQAAGAADYDRVYRRLSGGRPPKRAKVPGFFEAEGGVARGTFGGVEVWAGDDSVEGRLVARIEVDRDLPLAGRCWFVAREEQDVQQRIADAWGVELPTAEHAAGVPALDRRFVALADEPALARQLAARDDVQRLLGALDDRDSVLLEPSGLSQWRTARSVFAIFARLSPRRYARRAAPLAAVAANLARDAAEPPRPTAPPAAPAPA